MYHYMRNIGELHFIHLYSKLIICSCRFASSEEQWEVPEWFLDDERKHRKKPVPVTKEMVEEFKQKWKEIDARPIKRVAEAKARKKRRVRLGENNNEKTPVIKLVSQAVAKYFSVTFPDAEEAGAGSEEGRGSCQHSGHL